MEKWDGLFLKRVGSATAWRSSSRGRKGGDMKGRGGLPWWSSG